jgi:hypothetical protein
VTSFVEGVTCRRADDGVFFLLALKVDGGRFVILTTDAKASSLLGDRAKKSEGFGAGRCPVYVDGAAAARWVATDTAAAPHAAALRCGEAAQANALGLVVGASRKRAAPPAGAAPLAAAFFKPKAPAVKAPPAKHEAPATDGPPAEKKKRV